MKTCLAGWLSTQRSLQPLADWKHSHPNGCVPGTKVCRFGEKIINHYEAEEEVEEEGPAQRPQSDHKKEALALVGRIEEDHEDEDEDEGEDNDEETPEATLEHESHLPEQADLIQLAAFREPCGANSQNFTSSSRSLLDGSAPRACAKQVDGEEIFAWKFMIKMFQCFAPWNVLIMNFHAKLSSPSTCFVQARGADPLKQAPLACKKQVDCEESLHGNS